MSKVIFIGEIAAVLADRFSNLFITFLYVANNQHRYFSGCEWLFACSKFDFAVGRMWIFGCRGYFGAILCRFVFVASVEKSEEYR